VSRPLRAPAWLVAAAIAGAFSALIAGVPAANAQSPIQKALSGEANEPTPAADGAPEGAAEANLSPERRIETLDQKRAEVAAERSALEATISGAPPDDDAAKNARSQIAHLHRLERLYARQIDSIRGEAVLRTVIEEVGRTMEAPPQVALGGEPPYSLALLDQLLDRESAEIPRKNETRAAVEQAQKSVAAAREDFAEREAERRAAKEALEETDDPAAIAAAQTKLRLAELASDVGRERVAAEQAALATARVGVELHAQSEAALAAQIEFVESHLSLAPEELAAQLEAIERREFAVRDGQSEAAQAVVSAERRLAAVQKRADAEPAPGPALAAELELRRIALLAAQRYAESLEEELDRLEELRRLRQGRVQLLSGDVSRDELRKWRDELTGAEAERERDRRLAESRRADTERFRAAIEARLGGATDGNDVPSDEQRWLREQERELATAIARLDEQIESLEEVERAAARLSRALGGREQRASFWDRIGDASDGLKDIWRRELFAVEDNSITIGKLAGAVLVFLLGILLSRWLARGLAALIRRRSALDEGALSALQSLVFYFLIALFFLIALRSVNIPLTVFTVAGGALAIGIGFGSQTIINNFVSGLILMVERPIKVGDLVVFDGASGRVERIGPRSTRIRTFDNVHLIVPNSKLLENNVINWTLSDDVIRTRITVGVAYGSPTRTVERLLLEQIAAQPDILPHPPPVVLFEDFAADALLFQADFWVKLSPLLDQRVLRSNLRHALDQCFRENGISIAFPQRDVHLDATRPIPVRVVDGADPRAGENP
jgi:small-conductance mechanosensitive channel